MIVVAGCIIEKDNKILMVKEAKKKCYGQWNFPAGHLEENETIKEAAIREVYEETGCKVKLTGVLPVVHKFNKNENLIMIRFVAKIEEENINFNESEILDVKWIDIEDIKNMKEEELRGYNMSLKFLDDYEKNHIYPVEIFE